MLARLVSYVRRHHIGFLALSIALSGTAYAATLPRNSVGTAQLKKNAVTAPKVKKNAITTAKIANSAVTGAKVRAGTLTGLDINVGTLPKVPSATVADTATSAGAANSLAAGDVNAATLANPPGTLTKVEASCDAGLKGISAGVRVADPNFQYVVDLYPVDLDTWAANVFNDSGPIDATTTLFVICGSINTVTGP